MTLVTFTDGLPANGDDAYVDKYNAAHNATRAVLNGQIDQNNLADNGVTTIKINDESVTTDKLATTTRKRDLAVWTRTTTSGATFPDSASQGLKMVQAIPDDYVSGDLTVKILLRGPTSGNMMMQRDTFRFRKDTAHSQIDSSVTGTVAMGTGSKEYSFTVSSSNFQAGDTIRFDITRLGSDASDTGAGDADYDGGWIEYTGRA